MSPVFAQTGAVGNAVGDLRNGLLGQSRATLTEGSSAKNAVGSCDSTCDAMGVGNAPAAAAVAAFMTQVVACGAGYTGSKSQTRNQNPDGSFTPWVDADTSLCVCAPTYSDATQMCAAPLGGTFVQRTPWVCNAGVGSLGAPTTVSNSCFTPCALPAVSSQSQSLSCAAGYSGAVTQSRNASCPGGVGSNSSPVWSSWATTSNSCVRTNYSYSIRSYFCGIYSDFAYTGPRLIPTFMDLDSFVSYFGLAGTPGPGETLYETGSGGAFDFNACPIGPIQICPAGAGGICDMTSWG